MSELLTFIVPAYNVEKYIGQCIDSLVHQTLINHKVIIINDGSSDQTEEVCLKYKEEYPNLISYIYQDNAGQGAARNHALKYVDTPWVTFLDSDDWLTINYVEIFSKWLEDADVAPEIVFTLPWVYDDCNKKILPWMDKPLYDRVFKTEENLHGLFTNVRKSTELFALEVSPCRKIFSFRFLRENHFSFPEGVKWEDVPGHFELLHQANLVASIPEIGFFYRTNQSEQTTSGSGVSRLDKISIFKELIKIQNRYHFNQVERGFVIRQIVHFSKWGIDTTNTEYLHKLLEGFHEIYADLSVNDIQYYLDCISTDSYYDEGFIKCLKSSRYDDLFEYKTRDRVVKENAHYHLDNPEKRQSIIYGGLKTLKRQGFRYTAKYACKKIFRK